MAHTAGPPLQPAAICASVVTTAGSAWGVASRESTPAVTIGVSATSDGREPGKPATYTGCRRPRFGDSPGSTSGTGASTLAGSASSSHSTAASKAYGARCTLRTLCEQRLFECVNKTRVCIVLGVEGGKKKEKGVMRKASAPAAATEGLKKGAITGRSGRRESCSPHLGPSTACATVMTAVGDTATPVAHFWPCTTQTVRRSHGARRRGCRR